MPRTNRVAARMARAADPAVRGMRLRRCPSDQFPAMKSLEIFGIICVLGIWGASHGNTNADRAIIFRSVALCVSGWPASVGVLFYPTLAAARFARLRINFAIRLRWLRHRGKSSPITRRTSLLGRIRGWLFCHRYSSATCPNRRRTCLLLNLPISKSVVRLNATEPAWPNTFQSPCARSIAAAGLGQSIGSPAVTPPSMKSKGKATKEVISVIGYNCLSTPQETRIFRIARGHPK